MTIFQILLILHIVGGGLSLLLGTWLVIAKKGDKNHRFLGNIFFFAMLLSAFVSLPMAVMHHKYFLFIIGIFTAYMLLTGRRYLQMKTENDVKIQDWITTAVMLIFGLGFMGMGGNLLLKGNDFGTVLIVFGLISLFLVYSDYVNYSGKSKIKNFGLLAHIQRMLGSYIASVTAFLVVNNHFLPNVLGWLLPTIVITPLIFKWSRQYRKM